MTTSAIIICLAIGVVVIIGIGMAILGCVTEKWQKKLDQRSVKSIVDRPRNIIK